MFGQVPQQPQLVQPIPMEAQGPQSDPMHQAALEQLLRTIADRTAGMDAKDIITLTAAFVAAANNAESQAMGGVSASATSLTTPGLAQQQIQQQQLQLQQQQLQLQLQQKQQQQQLLANGMDGLDLGTAGFTIDGNAGMMLDPFQQQQALQQKLHLPTLAEVVGTLQTVKVSAKTNVKSIAGAMSKALRTCEAFVATSVGPDGVNHAMKALCIARCYLAAEGLDLTATVTEVQPDVGISTGQCYAFIVVRIVVPAKPGPWASAGVGRTEPQERFSRPPGHQTDMKVAGSGMAGPVAGAIAKCLREDREVLITAVGPASVTKCVQAMALARNALRAEGFELFFFPGFEYIIMQGVGPGSGKQHSCVRVHVWPESTVPVEAAAHAAQAAQAQAFQASEASQVMQAAPFEGAPFEGAPFQGAPFEGAGLRVEAVSLDGVAPVEATFPEEESVLAEAAVSAAPTETVEPVAPVAAAEATPLV